MPFNVFCPWLLETEAVRQFAAILLLDPTIDLEFTKARDVLSHIAQKAIYLDRNEQDLAVFESTVPQGEVFARNKRAESKGLAPLRAIKLRMIVIEATSFEAKPGLLSVAVAK